MLPYNFLLGSHCHMLAINSQINETDQCRVSCYVERFFLSQFPMKNICTSKFTLQGAGMFESQWEAHCIIHSFHLENF